MASTKRSSFGHKRLLPSGRWQASYIGLDQKRHNAPHTFEAGRDADAWLYAREREIRLDEWRPPTRQARQTFTAWAEHALARRELTDKTRENYDWLLRSRLLPTFGDMPLRAIRIDDVDDWYHSLDPKTPNANSKAYNLLTSIMKEAVQRQRIDANPCVLRGAGSQKNYRDVVPATPLELNEMAEAMPPRLRLLVLLAGWCALRSGEVRELRARDVDLDAGSLSITRSVVFVGGKFVVKPPKTRAGVRKVVVPPHLHEILRWHLAECSDAPSRLLFPSAGDPERHLAQSTLTRPFYKARARAGREDLTVHDLRHTGASYAAEAGASIPVNMRRLGHTTPHATQRYQHAMDSGERRLAADLSTWAIEQGAVPTVPGDAERA